MSEKQAELRFTRTVPGEPEDVYYAFSTAQGWRDWLVEAALFRTPAGGSYHLSWDTGWYAAGEVVRLEKGRAVELSWHGKGDPADTRVSITLEPAGGGTRVEIRHSGFGDGPAWEASREQVARGWELGLENLESVFETGADLRVTRRPMLGIMGSDFNERIAAEIGVPVTEGARIQDAIDGMGPAQAGMQGGDVIVSMDGTPIRDWPDLGRVLQKQNAGDKIEVEFYRGADKHQVEMQLSKRPIPETPLDPQAFAQRYREVTREVLQELREAMQGVSEHEAEYAPKGEWSVKQILAHLIEGEEGNHTFLRNLLNDGEPQYPDFGENRTERVTALVAVTPTMEALLERLERAQAEACALIELCTPLSKRKGVMWRAGMYLLHYPGEHEREHIAQMQRTLEQARAVQQAAEPG